MHPLLNLGNRVRRVLVIPTLGLVIVACGGAGSLPPGTSATAGTATSPGSPGSSAVATGSSAPDSGGGTGHGDIPDNAVFLTYHGTNPAFSIKYVEGWQVTQQPAGVVIRDKDSSETVTAVAAPSDIAAYVASTDLPTLRAQAGFQLVKQETVTVGGSRYIHLVFHLPSPPDPVTGKQVASTIDRYYVPGPTGLAVVSLSTPDGVDNVDAFRLLIESFRWS